jgi:hypothetical protein
MPLRVTIELIPHGVEYLVETVFSLYIVNDGTGSKEYGNYQYTSEELIDSMYWRNSLCRDDVDTRTFRKLTGYIGGFPRKQTAKQLVAQIIQKLLEGERNEKV